MYWGCFPSSEFYRIAVLLSTTIWSGLQILSNSSFNIRCCLISCPTAHSCTTASALALTFHSWVYRGRIDSNNPHRLAQPLQLRFEEAGYILRAHEQGLFIRNGIAASWIALDHCLEKSNLAAAAMIGFHRIKIGIFGCHECVHYILHSEISTSRNCRMAAAGASNQIVSSRKGCKLYTYVSLLIPSMKKCILLFLHLAWKLCASEYGLVCIGQLIVRSNILLLCKQSDPLRPPIPL